ncbi:MAG: hypothetical protein ACOCXV_00690 [Bacteroidota bacterium]
MASKREIKKDINFLTNEVLETCSLHYHLKPNKEEIVPQIHEIMEETLALRNELIYKVNHPDKNLKGGELHAWYAQLLNQMMQKTDEVFEKLGRLGQ